MTSSSGKVKTAKDKLSSVWFEQTLQDGKDNAHVIFTKIQTLDSNGNINDCHDCSAAIGAITYKLIDNQWQIISKQPILENEFSSWGDAPKIKQAKTFQLSPKHTALLIQDSGGGFGETYEWTDIFVFYKNHWVVSVISTGGDNSGNCGEGTSHKCWGYRGKISAITSIKEYPDLLVTITGTEEDIKGNIVPAKNAIYFFNGKGYEYVEKQQQSHVGAAPESMPKTSTLQTTSSADTPQMMVMRMLEYALNDGGLSHESEIQQTKLQIESLPRPPKGNKKEARAINDKGLASSKEGDINNAVKMFEEANKLDKSDIEIVSNLGYSYLKQGNLDSAQQIITMALIMSPGRATAWENLGDVFGLKGDVSKAVACFSNTYRFSKDRLKTHQYMKKLNEKEDMENLKQARDQVIKWAEKSYPNI